MISNTKLIQKHNGYILAVENERRAIIDGLKSNLNRYFKGIGIKAVIGNFNNGDLRISVKKANLKGFDLEKLFKAFNLEYNVTNETKTFISFVVYVFDG